MLIYIEKQAKNYYQTQKIIEKYKKSEIIYIDNYKNIFDKSYENIVSKKALIIAKLNSPSITKAPIGYGHNDDSYFLKTSLNCVFNCSYCYLKGLFKNENMVIFVNYEDIKESIKIKVSSLKNKNIYTQNGKFTNDSSVWFYSGDYSDVVGINIFSNFIEEFVPFFEELNGNQIENFPQSFKNSTNQRLGFKQFEEISENSQFDSENKKNKNFPQFFNNSNNNLKKQKDREIMLEIRTKSADIKPFLDLGFVPKNTEIAFSLNPQILIEKYEKGTSSLDERIKSINILLEKGFRVGLRFLPLLPVKNYKELYSEFIEYIEKNIDMTNISSTFASGLLYTKKDYNKIFAKYKELDILHMLELDDSIFYRESRKVRDDFYKMFKKLDKKCLLCLDD